MYDIICKEFSGYDHISITMTTDYQVDDLLKEIGKRTSLKRLILYCTTSLYLRDYKDSHLLRVSHFMISTKVRLKALAFQIIIMGLQQISQ